MGSVENMRKDIKLIVVMLLICTLIGTASASYSNPFASATAWASIPQDGSTTLEGSNSVDLSSADATAKATTQGEKSQSGVSTSVGFDGGPSANSIAEASGDVTETYSHSHAEFSSNVEQGGDSTTQYHSNVVTAKLKTVAFAKAFGDDDVTAFVSGNINK
jgi:hypothetical protein